MKRKPLGQAVSTATTRISKLAGLVPVLALALHPMAYGQEKKKEVGEIKLLDLEEIVVTGTPGGAGVRKMDASFAISTVNAESINQFSPKSTADLFKTVPGVWVESSGGVAGANIFVRGLPGSGDAPFVTVQLQGAPVFPPPTVSFLENSTLFRLDETIERMEALRGGPNPVFSNGQPGLTTNFRLKEGGEETEGVLKYTTSDYDLSRVDAMVRGKLAQDLYYMVGGYISSSPGIRDAGFNSEEGQQFTVNITKDLENGSINLYTRNTDDHGVWYTPTPVNVSGVGNDFTYLGTLNRNTTIDFGPDNETQAFDFGEGRGWDGAISGGSIELDVGDGWTFTDRFNFTAGNADTLGLVTNGPAVRLSDLGLTSATTAVTGSTLGANDFVQQVGFWVVRKDIDSFTNDFSIAKSWNSAKLTVGYYASRFSSDDWWALGNNERYMHVKAGGEQLDMVVNTLDQQMEALCTNVTANPDCHWNYDINANGDGRSNALYAAVEWDITYAIQLDGGLRFASHEIEYTVDEGLTGAISKSVEYDESVTPWTVGLNYSLTDNMGVFVRLNDGNRLPYFDDFRDGFALLRSGDDLIQDITQYEAGYKFSSDYFAVFATGFFNEVENRFVRNFGDPVQTFTSEAYGAEIDASFTTDIGFDVYLNATIQKSEITDSPENPANEGNENKRQPGWQLRITPSYAFELGQSVSGSVYGTLTAVDDRFENNENTVKLDGYEKVDLGVILTFNEKLKFQLAVDNVTDDEGLTEGDPRSDTSANARPILPRSTKFSVAYQF